MQRSVAPRDPNLRAVIDRARFREMVVRFLRAPLWPYFDRLYRPLRRLFRVLLRSNLMVVAALLTPSVGPPPSLKEWPY